MNDLSSLLGALDEAQTGQQEVVIATVVKVEGSAYRRPGARMIIASMGEATGTVSGGCLESDVSKKAWWLTASGKPSMRTYSTGEDDDELEDAELSFGLGCNGTVHILFERIDPLAASLVVDVLREVKASGVGAALATVIGTQSERHTALGERVAIRSSGQVQIEMRERWLATAVAEDLKTVLDARRSATRTYATRTCEGADGVVEVLLEYIAAPRRLVVFGAGHDAMPLVSMARLQGWHITVIDARSHFARPQRFPDADQVLSAPLQPMPELHGMVADAAVVVMTHSLSQDRHWLGQVLESTPRYIGQLGPRSRTERLLDELPDQAREAAAQASLHYPVGLDLGGDAPHSVALSILSEINAVFNGRSGGMLKHRQASIHAVDVTLEQARELRMIS
ncbi:XdhC family protein [Pseudomonas petrae]|uniref:XdhC family protein n=1 Tax=Pseudomonas petrae TaxID=2912190 RepID=A0ABS9I6H9_9PSED|nr:XdhC/CoxI family protein [Pseudomonas petrae]MCF7530739.1 XdhC family protein [Pseudomonas petrae]MCF7536412.1 XdhC family protein [Pseudomonas petrae]MCF7542954.1 XdhC family protein [Pseudomonas petrae]